jgi:hypothetical protein
MSCTDKFNALRKLREGEREKNREREIVREREREREREKKWTEWRVRSFEFGSLDIQLQFSNYEQTTISEAQRISAITHRKKKIINMFKSPDKT